jgi:hypothetical protein
MGLMVLRRIVVVGGLIVATLAAASGPAGAAGGGGASFCSNSGPPTGGAPLTYGNAGEIISWGARNIGNGQFNHPGPVVASFCNPSPSGP